LAKNLRCDVGELAHRVELIEQAQPAGLAEVRKHRLPSGGTWGERVERPLREAGERFAEQQLHVFRDVAKLNFSRARSTSVNWGDSSMRVAPYTRTVSAGRSARGTHRNRYTSHLVRPVQLQVLEARHAAG